MAKRLWLVLLPTLSLVLLAACSRNAPAPEGPLPEINISMREAVVPTEPNPEDMLSIHFIDVGEGDAILVVQGNYAMLVDGGPPEKGLAVLSYLRGQGVERLEYLIATHPFADHVGGLPDVLRRMSVRNVLLPMTYHDTTIYNSFLMAVEDSGANVAVPFAGLTFSLGKAHITVLSPNPSDEWEHKANYSIVMRLEFI